MINHNVFLKCIKKETIKSNSHFSIAPDRVHVHDSAHVLQGKWCHIEFHLIGTFTEKEKVFSFWRRLLIRRWINWIASLFLGILCKKSACTNGQSITGSISFLTKYWMLRIGRAHIGHSQNRSGALRLQFFQTENTWQ